MSENADLAKAMDDLEKVTKAIRQSQHGRTRPLIETRPAFGEPDPQQRIDQLEDAVFAIEKVLRALKA